MLHDIAPMLAVLHETPFDDPNWIYEIKWDGYRAVAEVDGANSRLYSRNRTPFEETYRVVHQELCKLNGPAVLDGELVVVDAAGNASFQRIQNFQRQRDEHDLRYYVFDLLYLHGQDLRERPLLERKAILADWLVAQGEQQYIRYSDHIVGEGKAFFAIAEGNNLEGIMAKDGRSPYRTGQRSSEWRKLKTHHKQPVVVCGYTDPKGGRKWFGSLIMGVYDADGTLRHVGNAGSGYNDKTLQDIYQRLQPLRQETSPFDGSPNTKLAPTRWGGGGTANWVRPELVAEVSYTEWTNDGRLRHPVFLGLREGIDPQSVRQLQGMAAAIVPTTASDMATSAAPTPKPSSGKPARAKVTKAEGPHPSPLPAGEGAKAHDFKGKDRSVQIARHEVALSNLDKPYFPPHELAPDGYTKGDVIAYYQAVAEVLLPHLKDRPQSLRRCPNGITGECFYHKDMDSSQLPPYARAEHVEAQSPNYLVCDNAATLAWMNQLGSIDIHPFTSRIPHTDRPDWFVLDLDPDGNPMPQIVQTAQVIKRLLDEAGADSFLKTSGSTGLHIVVPLGAQYDYDQARQFAELIARMAHAELPDFTSIERATKNRKGQIYIDFLQNRGGQTIAAPYSLRPKPGAPLSMPLDWGELTPELRILDYHLGNALPRIHERGDLFASLLTHKGIDLELALQRMGGNG